MRTASLINRDAVQSPVRYNLCSTTYYRRKLPITPQHRSGQTPKRKVVGSNPARNVHLKGGDRKNRFPLLPSQKTKSV